MHDEVITPAQEYANYSVEHLTSQMQEQPDVYPAPPVQASLQENALANPATVSLETSMNYTHGHISYASQQADHVAGFEQPHNVYYDSLAGSDTMVVRFQINTKILSARLNLPQPTEVLPSLARLGDSNSQFHCGFNARTDQLSMRMQTDYYPSSELELAWQSFAAQVHDEIPGTAPQVPFTQDSQVTNYAAVWATESPLNDFSDLNAYTMGDQQGNGAYTFLPSLPPTSLVRRFGLFLMLT